MLHETVETYPSPTETPENFSPSLRALKPVLGRDVAWLSPQTRFIPSSSLRGAFLRVLRGCIILVHEMKDGRRQILDVLGRGRLISVDALLKGQSKAISLTFTSLKTLDPEVDQDMIGKGQNLTLRRAYAHALLLGRKKSSEKVATALLDLSHQFSTGGSKQPSFTLHLMRSELADWLGLTLETVSRCLSDFRRKGLIAFDRSDRIIIRDAATLTQLAGGNYPSA